MKLREKLARLRLRLVQGESEPPIHSVDELATSAGGQTLDGWGAIPTPAPTNWVPSQQDERPRH
jgi:hypothetical protein